MPRNIEIKARIESIDELMPRAAAIADQGPAEIAQDDTFFACHSGRLKLRAFAGGDGELIYYRRPDQSGPKESFYLIAKTADANALRDVLTQAYGQVGRVQKRRVLYLVGPTRIHLDSVTGLGSFLELEVVLEEHASPEAGVRTANEIMARLGVEPTQLIEGAYLDLLAARHP